MYKTASLDSLNLPRTLATSVLKSTTNPEVKPSSFSKLTRRVAIIPAPNRPVGPVTSGRTQSSINANIPLMNTIVTTDKSIDLHTNKKFLLRRKQNSAELLHVVDN